MRETKRKAWSRDQMAKPMKYFGIIQVTLSILIMPCGFLIWGMAAIPGIWLFQEAGTLDEGWLRLVVQGAAVGIGLLFWCLLDLLILGMFGLILRPKSEAAQAPTQSWLTIRWAFMSLFQRLALPSLKWMVPSFVGNIYFQMMGLKIGKGAQLNTSSINDAYMIEIGEKTVIGGDAVINGHLFENNGIHMAKVKIGSRCLVGTHAQINPGCIIGDGAVIASKAVLPKHTEVPAGEVWGGIPAKCIRRADGSKPE
jgi:acetyltransferase-like isoleucine patch superfamily enzyme